MWQHVMFCESTLLRVRLAMLCVVCYVVTVVRKCLLSFGAEPFVFQVAIQKFKDQDI